MHILQLQVKHENLQPQNYPLWSVISYGIVRRKKRAASTITLQEHMESIAAKGGNARAAKLSAARKTAIAKKGGKAGGKARAAVLTREERADIARKAAAARWSKKPNP